MSSVPSGFHRNYSAAVGSSSFDPNPSHVSISAANSIKEPLISAEILKPIIHESVKSALVSSELVTLIREAIDKQITDRVSEIIQPVIEQTIASRLKEKLDKAVAKCDEQVNAVLINNSKICHLIIDCIKVFAPAPVKKNPTILQQQCQDIAAAFEFHKLGFIDANNFSIYVEKLFETKPTNGPRK